MSRPEIATIRQALQAELSKPDPDNPDRTICEAWAERIISQASTLAEMLEVMRFVEGENPPDDTF
jgi:hypothetical protein